MQVQVYMDSVARNASPDVAATALRRITDVACSKYFHLNATKMIELLSCTLSFASYDDTRVLAYESLERAVDYMRANLDEMDNFDTPSGSSHARNADDGASPNRSDPHAQAAPTDDIAQVNEQFEQMMAAEFDADDDLGIVVPHADSDDEMALNLTLIQRPSTAVCISTHVSSSNRQCSSCATTCCASAATMRRPTSCCATTPTWNRWPICWRFGSSARSASMNC